MDDNQNTCYECGLPIHQDDHFCDTECMSAYRKRAQRKHAGKVFDEFKLSKSLQTRWRKKMGLPRRIDPNK